MGGKATNFKSVSLAESEKLRPDLLGHRQVVLIERVRSRNRSPLGPARAPGASILEQRMRQ